MPTKQIKSTFKLPFAQKLSFVQKQATDKFLTAQKDITLSLESLSGFGVSIKNIKLTNILFHPLNNKKGSDAVISKCVIDSGETKGFPENYPVELCLANEANLANKNINLLAGDDAVAIEIGLELIDASTNPKRPYDIWVICIVEAEEVVVEEGGA